MVNAVKKQGLDVGSACDKSMIMMNLSQHVDHSGLQHLEAMSSESYCEYAIGQNWKNTSGP
jgi:hypothetical protein